MNKKHIFIYLLIALPLLLTSCLKDQEDIFSDSASARTEKYLANAQRVLTSSEYGWLLNYYPDRAQSYGGYVYTLKFDNENVIVGSELEPGSLITSSYTLDNEDGPVIAFDTYNTFLHYFATPSGSSGAGGYEAYDGDFIFIIMDISDDENTITLKGNRSGNIMYMHRLESDGSKYIETVSEVEDLMDANEYGLRIDDAKVTVMKSYHKFTFTAEENGEEISVTAPYILTPNGFEFYEPVTFLGHEFSGFKVSDSGEFEGLNDPTVVLYKIVFNMTKEDFLGNFVFTYESYFGGFDGGNITIKENPNEENGIIVSDMFLTGFTMKGYYDLSKNQIYLYDDQELGGVSSSSGAKWYAAFVNAQDYADITINVRSDGTMVSNDWFGIILYKNEDYTDDDGWFDISVSAVFTRPESASVARAYKVYSSEWQPKKAGSLRIAKKTN